jgi:hypothetical protein
MIPECWRLEKSIFAQTKKHFKYMGYQLSIEKAKKNEYNKNIAK